MCNSKILGVANLSSISSSWGPIKPAQATTILPLIEQRICATLKPQVEQARVDLEAILAIELGKLGINPKMTGMFAFARESADKYFERLVEERIAELVDSLVAGK